MDHLENSLAKVRAENEGSDILLGGDFNLGGIDWLTQSTRNNCSSKGISDRLLDIANDNGLTQVVSEPTYRGKSMLDLLFTSTPNLVEKTSIAPGITENDHDLVQIETKIKAKINRKTPRNIFLYHKANTIEIRSDLSAFHHKFMQSDPLSRSVDGNWNLFREAIENTIEKNIPQKTLPAKWNQPWINKCVKRAIRKRQRLYSKAKKTGNSEHWNAFRTFRNQVNKLTQKSYWNYINKLLEPKSGSKSIISNKKFFQYIKSQKKESCGVSPMKTRDGLKTDPKEKAEALNQQFNQAFTEKSDSPIPDKGESTHPDMPNFTINNAGISHLINKLDPNKASGPDQIPAKFLILFNEEVTPILKINFQQSIDTSHVPSQWKEANIAPIFKKGDRSDPINYRPVSLTSICCKMLEHIIVSNMMDFLDSKNILVDIQHGFRAGRSCETQLIQTVHDFARNLDSKIQTDVGVLDFKKAFDKVDHRLLKYKLDFYGIRGKTLKWIESFLSNRSQRVVVDGQMSSPIEVTSGVPQGSVLGPILFLVFINDIGEGLNSQARLFADDCLIYRAIKSIEDCISLQEDLNKLKSWADKWKMEFNVSKCFILHISLARKHKFVNIYTIDDETLTTTSSTKYLGVTISSDLKWNIHIDTITSKANRVLNFIRRNLKRCPQQLKDKAYLTYVRPQTEYCSTVWDPHSKENINKIEKVQRRAARFTTNNYRQLASVTEMLHKLKWQSLQERRMYFNLILFYRVAHKFVVIPYTILPPMADCSHNTRHSHAQQFLIPQCRINAYKFSFVPRTTPVWNALPSTVISSPTTDSFKENLLASMA